LRQPRWRSFARGEVAPRSFTIRIKIRRRGLRVYLTRRDTRYGDRNRSLLTLLTPGHSRSQVPKPFPFESLILREASRLPRKQNRCESAELRLPTTVDVIRTSRSEHSLLPVRDVKTNRAHNYARIRARGMPAWMVRALSGDPSEAAIYPRNTKRRKSRS
jgi:hypothetical protein